MEAAGITKEFKDTPESFSEALVDCFADPMITANAFVPADEFEAYISELDAAGFQVKVHAIGDGTVRATLDGYGSSDYTRYTG